MVISYCLRRRKCCRQAYFWVNPDVAGLSRSGWQVHGALATVPPQNHDADSRSTSGTGCKIIMISIHFAGGVINAGRAGDNTCWSGLYLTLSPRIRTRMNTARQVLRVC